MLPNIVTRYAHEIARWAATLTVALLPLFFLPVPWATLGHAKFLLIALGVGIGLAAFALSRVIAPAFVVPRSLTLLFSLLIPMAYIASAFAGRDLSAALAVERDTVLASFLWVGALFLAVFGFESRERVMSAYKTLLALAGAVTLFQLVRLVLGPDVITFGGALVGPAATLVGSWHDLGIFLGLTALLALAYLSSTHAEGLGRVFAWSLGGLAVLGLVLVSLSDVWLVLSLVCFAIVVYHARIVWRRTDPGNRALARLARHSSVAPYLLLAVVSLVFVFAGPLIHARLPESIRVVQVDVRPSWQGTIDIASSVYQSAGALFGSGPNTFTRQWGLYKPAGVNETAFWNADFAQSVGFIPTSFITLGIVGMLAWLAFLGAFLFESTRALVRSFSDKSVEPVMTGLFGGALFLWVLNFTYPPGPVIIALAFMLTGLAFSWAVHSGVIPTMTLPLKDAPRGKTFATALLLIVGGAGMVLASGLFVRAIAADMLVNKSIVSYSRTGDVEASRKTLSRALSLYPHYDRAHRAGVELGIIQLSRLAESADPNNQENIAQLQQTLAEAIQHGLAAVSSNAADYQNWLTLARAYEQLVGAEVPGAYERAEEAYKNAALANPSNPTPEYFLARLALFKNDATLAKQYLDAALAKKPNFAEAHFMRSQIAVAEGDATESVLSAERAVLSAPQEPVAWFQLGALHYAGGTYDKAIAALEQAVILNNNYANALYVLALSYAQTGRIETAVQALQQVLLLNPENEGVKNLIRSFEGQSSADAE